MERRKITKEGVTAVAARIVEDALIQHEMEGNTDLIIDEAAEDMGVDTVELYKAVEIRLRKILKKLEEI